MNAEGTPLLAYQTVYDGSLPVQTIHTMHGLVKEWVTVLTCRACVSFPCRLPDSLCRMGRSRRQPASRIHFLTTGKRTSEMQAPSLS
jgi:hypothetical protein